MAVTLQRTPFTLRSRPIPVNAKLRFHTNPPSRISFSGLKLPSSPVKIAASRRSKRGGARMSVSPAETYAVALADVAQSNGTLESTAADVDKLDEMFSDRAVLGFFANPTVALEKKREVVDEICRVAQLQPHTANFLNILVEMKRAVLMREIAREYEVAYNRATGTELAVVSSVVPLESQHLAQVAKGVQKLTGAKNVRIKTAIDPSLVAGFTVRFGSGGSKLIDMSVKKQLADIASQIDIVGDLQLAL